MLAGHTTARDASRCMDTNHHKRSQPSQQKPARSQQSRACWTFARACKACAAICCDLHASKNLAINQIMVAYGSRQNPTAFTRANNSDLLRSLKHLMETRLLSRWCNGLERLQQWSCYLQGPGFESHLRPVEFLSCNKVSPLSNQNPTLTSVPCAPP